MHPYIDMPISVSHQLAVSPRDQPTRRQERRTQWRRGISRAAAAGAGPAGLRRRGGAGGRRGGPGDLLVRSASSLVRPRSAPLPFSSARSCPSSPSSGHLPLPSLPWALYARYCYRTKHLSLSTARPESHPTWPPRTMGFFDHLQKGGALSLQAQKPQIRKVIQTRPAPPQAARASSSQTPGGSNKSSSSAASSQKLPPSPASSS